MTGFTNPEESEHDQFVLGHTGTSISLACGLAKTRDMMGDLNGGSGIGNVIAVIGDGSLSSAIAFEGLNNAAEQGGNLIIIVNDNEMSIAEDFGGMYGPLARLRESGGTAEPNLFHAFGLDYRYVKDGNNVAALVEVLEQVKDIDHPIVLHVHTLKGLGLDAEDAAAGLVEGRCEANHWQDPLSAADRLPGARKYYGEMAMRALEERFATEPGLVVISLPPPGRTASPGRSASVPARTTLTPASRRSMRSPSPPASPRPAGVRCWPRRPRSSSAPTTSCSRSWP